MIDPPRGFVGDGRSDVECWCGIVLFGCNIAWYKFALAKSLLELASQERETVSLSELAVPFSRHVSEHLAKVDHQGTSHSSRFLDACRFYNAGRFGPDGFNLGGNSSPAAGQTVAHAQSHVIPRYHGDVEDPRGGIRWVVPSKAPYWTGAE